MTRSALLGGLFLLAATALARGAPAPEPVMTDPLPAKLAKPVKFTGFEADPKVTLQEVLDRLAEAYDLPFDVNEEAFREEQLEGILAAPVLDKVLPPMGRTTPAAVLRRVLARIPSESGATYLIRRDGVEITTKRRQQAEIWGENYQGPFLPLVHADFDKRPLADALKELADASGFNVVVDVRTADKAKTPVTASFLNLPLDTAVRTLADMAELKSVLNDNVLYVTTEARAVKLRPDANPGVGTAPCGVVGLCANGTLPGLTGGAVPALSTPARKAVFDKRPLSEALQELLEGSGYKLVVDAGRAGGKAKAPVSADLDGVPLETCLRVLADLADLKPVVLDNVVYLTSRENGKALQEEQEKRDAARFTAAGLGAPYPR